MKTVWKFALNYANEQTVEMPVDATILTVQVQYGVPCLWALVNPHNDLEKRTVFINGTGHEVDARTGPYIGTIQVQGGSLVLHVFEAKR